MSGQSVPVGQSLKGGTVGQSIKALAEAVIRRNREGKAPKCPMSHSLKTRDSGTNSAKALADASFRPNEPGTDAGQEGETVPKGPALPQALPEDPEAVLLLKRLAGTAKVDRRGFGCPSKDLPTVLRPIAFAGWRLRLAKDGRLLLISGWRNPDAPWESMEWLRSNYSQTKTAFLAWLEGVNRRGHFPPAAGQSPAPRHKG